MTGYTVNTGSNQKFSSGWDRVFGGEASAAKKAAKKSAAKAPAKAADKTPAKAAKKPAPPRPANVNEIAQKPVKKAAPGKKAAKAPAAKTVSSKTAAQASLTSGKR